MKEQVGGADVLEREWVWERRGALKTHTDYAFGLALIILCLLTVLEKNKNKTTKRQNVGPPCRKVLVSRNLETCC